LWSHQQVDQAAAPPCCRKDRKPLACSGGPGSTEGDGPHRPPHPWADARESTPGNVLFLSERTRILHPADHDHRQSHRRSDEFTPLGGTRSLNQSPPLQGEWPSTSAEHETGKASSTSAIQPIPRTHHASIHTHVILARHRDSPPRGTTFCKARCISSPSSCVREGTVSPLSAESPRQLTVCGTPDHPSCTTEAPKRAHLFCFLATSQNLGL